MSARPPLAIAGLTPFCRAGRGPTSLSADTNGAMLHNFFPRQVAPNDVLLDQRGTALDFNEPHPTLAADGVPLLWIDADDISRSHRGDAAVQRQLTVPVNHRPHLAPLQVFLVA